jgi:serine/threonine protein kinase
MTMQVSKYRILRHLGQGATARVFEAEDPLLGRRVAIKQMKLPAEIGPEQKELLAARFRDEARILAGLRHTHIPQVIDLLEWDGVPAIVMELVRGQKLFAYAQQSPQLAELLQHLAEVAGALHYAHTEGIIHRDIKPDNVLITEEHGAMLVDFGVARNEGNIRQTGEGAMLGTIAYMAPEQLIDSTQADARSDIYSLGVVMYELLTGQLPFDGESPAAVILKIFNAEPTPPLEINPQLHPALAELMFQCLRKEPERRIQSARQLQYALNLLAQELRGEGSKLPHPGVTQPGLVRTSLPLQTLPTLGDLTGIRLSKTAANLASPPSVVVAPSTMGGIFHNYTLIDHLKMAVQEQFTGTLVVKTADGKQLRLQGAIWFDQGQLCHAELIRGDLTPVEALSEILCLPNGHLQKIAGTRAPFLTLNTQPTDTLLAEAQVQVAECQALDAAFSLTSVPTLNPTANLNNPADSQYKALLALIDGKNTIAVLQAKAPMDRLRTLRILQALQSSQSMVMTAALSSVAG